MAGPDKRAQIADALASMGYRRGTAEAAAAKLEDLTRPLSDLLRDGLAYARGDEPKRGGSKSGSDRKEPKVDDDGEKKGKRSWLGKRAKRAREFVREHPVGSALAGGVLIGGALMLAAGRAVGGTSSGDPRPAPPPPHPSAETAHAGATLTVKTPKGKGYPGGVPGVLRAQAGKGSTMVATVPAGTAVKVLDSALVKESKGSARWYRVETPASGAGWMHGGILSSATTGGA